MLGGLEVNDNYIHLKDFENFVRNRFEHIVNGAGPLIPRIAVKIALDDIFSDDASKPINPTDSIRKKITECLTKMDAHVKNRNYGMALKMQGAAVALQEVLDKIESTSQSNTLVDGDKLCDFCGLCDFQKQKRKK